jgi:hypothetical protein
VSEVKKLKKIYHNLLAQKYSPKLTKKQIEIREEMEVMVKRMGMEDSEAVNQFIY